MIEYLSYILEKYNKDIMMDHIPPPLSKLIYFWKHIVMRTKKHNDTKLFIEKNS